jgi:hypothetical protein
MIGVAAKAPHAAKTKAKGKGKWKAPAKAQVQTTLKSGPFAPPHDHDSAPPHNCSINTTTLGSWEVRSRHGGL